MIINKTSEVEILQTGNGEDSIDMTLDMSSAHILMNMLSKNLYSDGIGSAIRETVSNSLDSHRRAKCNKSIIVSLLLNSENEYEFSSEDFGTGLDADDVKNIISKYGMSTKRLEANSLGAMGLGFKAPLAYNSSFYFVCRKNEMERKYMMYENENGNSIDLLYEDKTKECNGVKVIIPVKNGDRWDFYNKIKEQLAYFQSVVFNVNVQGDTIDNEFKIHRADHYQISELVTDDDMHICLDDVYYPIDFSKLGISPLQVPIALRFGLSDGLVPVPSRESVLYNTKAKELILAKIKIVAEELITKYNSTIKEVENIQDVFYFYKNDNRSITIGEKELTLNKLEKYSDVKITNITLKNVKLLNLKELYNHKSYILSEYECKHTFYNHKFKENKSSWNKTVQLDGITSNSHYLYEDTIPFILKAYFRERHSSEKSFIKKVYSKTLFPKISSSGYETNYLNSLNLRKYPRNKWREIIKEFQHVQSLFLKNVTNINDYVIPQEWIDGRKKKRISISSGGERKVKLQGEITCKRAERLLRYNEGNNCKFVPSTYKLADLSKQKCLFVYTTHDNKMKLDALYEISKQQKITFLTFSDRDIKTISKLNIHNIMPYGKFMEGKNMPFKRIVTAKLISELITKNHKVFERLDVIQTISTSLYETLLKLKEYNRENNESCHSNVFKAMLEVAIENNLFDENVYTEYVKMNELLSKFTFINSICNRISYNLETDEFVPILIDMFKYHKQRIDYTHYNITLNEEVPEILTEEIIEELV